MKCEIRSFVLKIGVIDSGIGGLAVLKKLTDKLPHYEYLYFADNAYCPYGNKSEEKIIERLNFIADFFVKSGVSVVILACNTATGAGVKFLREKFKFDKVFGLEPSIKQAATCGAKKIALFTTKRTKECPNLKRLISECQAETVLGETDDLAFTIEKNIFDLEKIKSEVEKILEFSSDCDAIVLGCTHYIFLEKYITERFGEKVYDGVDGLINNVLKYLSEKEGELKKTDFRSPVTIYCSNKCLAEINYIWQLIANGYIKL